jgi:hypothetical protein
LNESDRLKLPARIFRMLVLRRILPRKRYAAPLAVAVACACACAGAAAGSTGDASAGAVFRVTLNATMTKDWSYVAESEQNGCPATTRVQGRHVVTLRSARRTLVRITFAGGRAVYSPAYVRFVGAQASQSGVVTRTQGQPPSCVHSVQRTTCDRLRRAMGGVALRFFRSRRNEISFTRTREFAIFPRTCPQQTASVRAERPSLDFAEGEIAEAEFRDPRIKFQTATGTAVETTDFEGDGDGKVVVRVRWQLRFERVG